MTKIMIIASTVIACVLSFLVTLKCAAALGYSPGDLHSLDQALAISAIAAITILQAIIILLILAIQRLVLRGRIQNIDQFRSFLKLSTIGFGVGLAGKAFVLILTYLHSPQRSWT